MNKTRSSNHATRHLASAMAVAAASIAATALPASAALDAHSYVQRGLTAQYDGIDNAGTGSHDSSATTWKNLAGDSSLDGVITNTVAWNGVNGWTNNQNGKPVTVLPGLAATTGTALFTLQFACTPSRDTERECFFSQYNAPGAVAVEHNKGGVTTGALRLYRNSGNGNDLAFDYMSTALLKAGQFASASVNVASLRQSVYLNGNLASTGTSSFGTPATSATSVIGGDPSRDNMAFRGTYNALRLYDRVLTAEETAVNAAVDAIRFNGASPGDFTLGGGWSFDGRGDLCVTVTAAASGDGSVSGSATVKQYSTTTLTATPASGAVFQRWMGDTDAITSGSIYDAIVTVTAADPVALTAVFATPAASSASLYVQDGLVAAYDGIDNAGTGSHDSSATTWADLTGNGNDGACDAKLSWVNGKGWTVSGDCKPVTVGTGIAEVISQTNCTIEVACTPSFVNKRFVYFSQYNGGTSYRSMSLENAVDGKYRLFRTRTSSSAGDYNWADITPAGAANTFVSFAFALANKYPKFYKDGSLAATATAAWGDASATTESVIGGEPWASSNRTGANFDSTYKVAFNGTYHAFRVYNVTLTAAEIAWNAGLDAVRFNGADAAATLGDGYSYDAVTDTLTATVSATATAGGKVSYRGGAASSSVSASFPCDGATIAALKAIPDAGFVFERWSGDTDLIATGSTMTPEITLDPDRAAALVANFRRNGDAADGKVFDLSFTGDATADGMTFSTTEAEEKQGYVTADVTLPILPTVTNANVSCLYLPQPTNNAGTGVYRQMAVSDKPAVTGDVATVFVRFRWDGPTLPAVTNYPDVLLNGYTSWNTVGQGFIVRLFSAANSTDAYPGFVFPQRVVDGNSLDIENVSGNGIVKPGEWIDLFASVYPSPTNPSRSNADIWYCRVPAWNSGSGGYFTAPTIGHRHYGDNLKIPRMETTSTTLQFGTEPGMSAAATTDSQRAKEFRGAIACAKGWNRLLSENEMFTVMAGFEGIQTFTNLETRDGCTVETGTLSTQEGRNVLGTAFLGDADTTHFQRALTTTYNTLRLVFDAPKGDKTYPFVYKTKITGVKSGNTQPLRLEFNGKTVWSSANVATGTEVYVELSEDDALPGLNELTWRYETSVANNWLSFNGSKHWLRLLTPDKPFVMVIR